MYITRVIAFWVDFGELSVAYIICSSELAVLEKKEWEFWIPKISITSSPRGKMLGFWRNYLQNLYSNLTETLIYVRIVGNLLVKHRQKKHTSFKVVHIQFLSHYTVITRKSNHHMRLQNSKNFLRRILAYLCWKLKCLVLHLTSIEFNFKRGNNSRFEKFTFRLMSCKVMLLSCRGISYYLIALLRPLSSYWSWYTRELTLNS